MLGPHLSFEGMSFNPRHTLSEKDSTCPCAGNLPCLSLFSEPLPARFNEVLPESRLSETQAPACFSIIVAASTAGPTGFTEIKSNHLLRAPQPLKQVIKGKWGVSEQMGESLICIRCHLHGWQPWWRERRIEIHHVGLG